MIRLGMKYKMSSHEYEMKNCEIERQDFLKILSVHGAHVTKKKCPQVKWQMSYK